MCEYAPSVWLLIFVWLSSCQNLFKFSISSLFSLFRDFRLTNFKFLNSQLLTILFNYFSLIIIATSNATKKVEKNYNNSLHVNNFIHLNFIMIKNS